MWPTLKEILLLLMLKFGESEAQSPIETAAKNLVGLISKPLPAKGGKFPGINGPKRTDRICIVGGGPAGIHMARSLKKRNFLDIIIYEKSNRLGGKSYDVTIDGTVHYMGTVFLEPNHFDTVVPLAKEYGLGELIQIPSANVFRFNSGNMTGSKLRTKEYILGSLKKITGLENPLDIIQTLLQDMARYVKIHQEMFGSYTGELMLRPDVHVQHRIRGTFLDFLKRENLLTLAPYFLIAQSLQGYGYLDEIGTLYGLLWNNPKFVVTSALRAIGQDKDPLSVYILKNGFEILWNTIIKEENVKVKFNSDIVRVKRRYGGGVDIFLQKNFVRRKEKCGWLVWAAPMEEFFKVAAYVSHEEFTLFKNLAPSIFTSSLVKMTSDIRNGPYTAFLENLNNKVEHGVIGEGSAEGLKIPNIRQEEVQTKWDENNNQEKVCSVLQLGKRSSDERTLNTILATHYKDGFNASNVEILQTISWEYFPRWTPNEVNSGQHWKVFDIQGLKSTWYIGSSVSFESVKSVLEYNNLVLRQWRKHPQ